jgi:hypothetical protein
MTEPMKFSGTARALLTAASARDDYLIRPPQLPSAAARQVARSLLSAGFADEVSDAAEVAGYAWRTGERTGAIRLRATALGLHRVALEPPEPMAVATPPKTLAETTTGAAVVGALIQETPPTDDLGAQSTKSAIRGTTPTGRLRRAAQALLDAWDKRGDYHDGVADLTGPVSDLRAAVATATAHTAQAIA